MELAAHWHRCQNLPKNECILLSAVYRWRDDPVKKGLAKGCVSFFCSECRWVSLTPTRGVTPFSLAQADFPSHFTQRTDNLGDTSMLCFNSKRTSQAISPIRCTCRMERPNGCFNSKRTSQAISPQRKRAAAGLSHGVSIPSGLPKPFHPLSGITLRGSGPVSIPSGLPKPFHP